MKLASLLSFVAGVVNVAGFFAVQKLTTNITGHFAIFADELVRKNFEQAAILISFILSFFAGAFLSNTMVEVISRRSQNARFANVVPVLVEITILISIASLATDAIQEQGNWIACALLFAMGLQNALVTYISNSVVRTTHLTGMFTDLGIELSQLFFYRKPEQLKKLSSSIGLRLAIITFFFLGCVLGGYCFFLIGIRTLLFAAICLVVGLVYDTVKYQVVTLTRKRRHE